MMRESGLLRKARRRKGRSQMEVAASAGVDIRLYQRWNTGSRPLIVISDRAKSIAFPV